MDDLVWLDPSKLAPWVKNPRRNDATVTEIRRSIEKLARDVLANRGETVPRVLSPEQLVLGFSGAIEARRENLELISGHARVKAAIQLNLPRVPVQLVDASEKGAHEQALRANKAGERTEWDVGLLSELGAELDLIDAGFGEREVADFGRAKRPDGRGMGLGGVDDRKAANPNRKLIVELFIACQDSERVEQALTAAMSRGASNRGAALVMLANAFLASNDAG